MTIRKKNLKITPLFILSALIAILIAGSSIVRADTSLSLLGKYIISYNLECRDKTLADGSFRGEEGILRIRPEVGRSLGLKVLVDQDYLIAKELFENADKLFEEVVEVMSSKEKEKFPGRYTKKVAETAFAFNKDLEAARRHISAYSSKLNPENDDRLKKDICLPVLEKLLEQSLEKASYNLRNGLGYFFNQCQDIKEYERPLNEESVKFVNRIFYEFTRNAPKEALERFDLDQCRKNNNENLELLGRDVFGKAGSRYIRLLEPILNKHNRYKYPVDPLLFMALMKRESNFDPHAVSHVGAAGLTQIMPSTGKGLGMKNIFAPSYFNKAGKFIKRETDLKRRALALIPEIKSENSREPAKLIIELMQESFSFGEKRKKLFIKYKRDLLRNGLDDRLDPSKAIEYGFKYFAGLLNEQKGDISLALACYNAGPHRVKMYKGVPPYPETITFRNKVLEFYGGYLLKLNNKLAACQ
ncbi:MAG: lytic transglycosylase domain-containing protein [Desulfobacterales bacterium]|nr:lytic transglycosylase domain-containing protein [Desulfobacterales bacterium]